MLRNRDRIFFRGGSASAGMSALRPCVLRRIQGDQYSPEYPVSSEKFSGNIYSGYRDAGTVAETWRKILKQLDVDVRIIVYLRRQDDFIQSLYTQLIHQGESLLFNEFKIRFSSECFNWLQLLSQYENSFSKDQLIVRRYTKSDLPDKSSLFFDFGSIIGSKELVSCDQHKLKNSGYSRDALEVARTLNPNLSSEEKRTMRKLLQKVSSKTLHEKYDYFKDDNRLNFFQRYYKSNQIVARKYFGEEALFSEPDISKFATDYEGLTVKGLLDIYKKTIKEVEKIKELSDVHQPVSIKQKIRKTIKKKNPILDKFVNLIKGQYN